MSKLIAESHNFDAEFEAEILQNYNVKVVDKTNAPWNVVFEGTIDNLIKMHLEHWGYMEETEIRNCITE